MNAKHFRTDYLKLRAVWKSVVTLVKKYFRKFSCDHLCPHLVYFATFEPVKKSLEFSLGGLENTGVQRLQPSRCDTHKSDFQMSHLLNKTCLSLHNGTTKPKKNASVLTTEKQKNFLLLFFFLLLLFFLLFFCSLSPSAPLACSPCVLEGRPDVIYSLWRRLCRVHQGHEYAMTCLWVSRMLCVAHYSML